MIKFLDLKKLNQNQEIEEALLRVHRNGWYILGEEVQNFESSLSNFCNSNFVIGVSNGLDALRLIFKAYIDQLSPREKHVLKIAQEHLETSFSLDKSIGFKMWYDEYKKKQTK